MPAPAASSPVAPTQAATPAPPLPADTSVPFSAQVARPIFALANAGQGTHVLTVNVTPDNLGSVTVRAHITGEGVRVELFAPNDAGRDALRMILADLRRDLSGSGVNTSLDLSSQNQPGDFGPEGRASGQMRSDHAKASSGADGYASEHAAQSSPRTGLYGQASTIDVLA